MENTLDPNKEVEVIPMDAIIKIEVSGHFYFRVFNLLTSYASEKGVEIEQILTELQTREPKDAYEANIVTMLTLTSSIEGAAKKQNLIVKKKVKDFLPPEGAPEN